LVKSSPDAPCVTTAILAGVAGAVIVTVTVDVVLEPRFTSPKFVCAEAVAAAIARAAAPATIGSRQ
jgi:hypothetical protein